MSSHLLELEASDNILSILRKISYANNLTCQTVEINFYKCSFFRSNYSAILLAFYHHLNNKNINCLVRQSRYTRLNNVLNKNLFYSQTCPSLSKPLQDVNNTVIEVCRIFLNDQDALEQVIDSLTLKGLNNVSIQLMNKILQKIFELFSNAFRHSYSEVGVVYAGQFYPNEEKLHITIVDFGVGIKKNVMDYLGNQSVSGANAIRWAIVETNSTSGTGGLGLSLLKELIKKTNGKLEIISNDGYYSITDGVEKFENLDYKFSGTVINIIFNTSDKIYAKLKGET